MQIFIFLLIKDALCVQGIAQLCVQKYIHLNKNNLYLTSHSSKNILLASRNLSPY